MIVGICDDAKADIEKTKQLLWNKKLLDRDKDSIQIYSPREVEFDLEEKMFQCDLMIMGIEFGEEHCNGILLGKRINEENPDCQIIYLTHFLKFAPEVYETEHCYYVIKSNMEIMLPRAIRKAKILYDKAIGRNLIEIVSGGHKVYIAQKDIMYVEKEQRLVRICTINKEYYSYQSLSSVALQFDNDMVRCHGGYIVNIKYVSGLEKDIITLENGKEIPIGKTYREQTKREYLRFWSERI